MPNFIQRKRQFGENLRALMKIAGPPRQNTEPIPRVFSQNLKALMKITRMSQQDVSDSIRQILNA